jgi:excisionase family DNA binding protein
VAKRVDPATMEALWDVQDVGRFLNVSRRTIDRLVELEGLPLLRLTPRTLRFEPQAVRAWLAARTSGNGHVG